MSSPLQTNLETKGTPLSLNYGALEGSTRIRKTGTKEGQETDYTKASSYKDEFRNANPEDQKAIKHATREGADANVKFNAKFDTKLDFAGELNNKSISAKTAPHRFDNTTGNRYSDKVTR